MDDAMSRDRIDSQVERAVDRRLSRATALGATRRAAGDLAVSATYDARARRLRLELRSGVGIAIPIDLIEGLAGVTTPVARTVRVEAGGYGLRWPAIDLDVSVPGLVAGCFGSKTWMSALARRGGSVSSPAKRRAARANGRKGGRPGKG